MDIDRDRDRPREGSERVRARLGDGSPNRWTARWMHTQKKIRLACPRVSSPISRESARRAYLGRVEDVRVVRALDGLRALRGFQVTVYRARTEPRAILAPAVRRAATRTGARTAVAEETVKADMIPGESGCEEVFRSRSIATTRARARGGGGN